MVEKTGCGFCISPYDPKVLSDKFQWLIENPESGRRMGQQGRKAAESKYNWANEEQILLHFYKNLNQIKKTGILTT
nr:hypothetical protein [Dyadobacter diqingensis]